MKKVISTLAVALLLTASMQSCTKCYVCKDKDSTSFSKEKFCDKDFDKGDIDAEIKYREAMGEVCHASSIIL